MHSRRSLLAAALAVPAVLAATAASASELTAKAGLREFFDRNFKGGDGFPFPPVPAARAEEMGKPPVVDYEQVWHPGHHEWNGKSYDWTPGQWVRRPESGKEQILWMPGHWKQKAPNSATYFWMPGHWVL